MKRFDWIKITMLVVALSGSLLTAAWRASALASELRHTTAAIEDLREQVERFQMGITQDLSDSRRDIVDLRERMARQEGNR